MNPALASWALVLALLGVGALASYLAGPGMAMALLGACLGTGATAALLRWVRGPRLGLRSVLTTGLILGLAVGDEGLPHFAALAGGCAVLIGCPPFARRGRRLLNPAMAGYLLALTLFPQQSPDVQGVDGLGAASALWMLQSDSIRTWTELLADPRIGALGDATDQYIALAVWAAGLALLLGRLIPWQIPLGFFGMLFLAASLGFRPASDSAGSGLFHLFSGGAALCGWMILTDPGCRARSGMGMLASAAFAGALLYATRALSPRADAVAATVLLANLALPAIDFWAQALARMWRMRVQGTARKVRRGAGKPRGRDGAGQGAEAQSTEAGAVAQSLEAGAAAQGADGGIEALGAEAGAATQGAAVAGSAKGMGAWLGRLPSPLPLALGVLAWALLLGAAALLERLTSPTERAGAIQVLASWEMRASTLPRAAPDGGDTLRFDLHRLDGTVEGCMARVMLRTQLAYSGRILLQADLDLQGGVHNLRARRHRETPGIGAPQLRASGWMREFRGHQWPDAVSGATFTTEAVLDTVLRLQRAFVQLGGTDWMLERCQATAAGNEEDEGGQEGG